MKIYINNSRGYALIIVLLIIIIIAIMTPPIISRIMSSSTQFQIVERELQLEKLGDMGVLYSEKAIVTAEENSKKVAELEADKIAKLEGDAASNRLPPSASSSERNAAYNKAYKDTYQREYPEEFKKEFQRVMEIYFPANSKVVSEDTNEFIGEHCYELDVKNDELYKYEAGYIIKLNATSILINYRVFMTVDGEYKIKDALAMQEKIITINFK
ncbi:hypothetical protein ACIQYS_00750 [Psychrobacillus sp. NPDC096426]|uniref:hypothetical protein n=1 Tax=Psychrobacillus sp. NPDC096426 TaxID=3364491 RepID=UPI003800F817